MSGGFLESARGSNIGRITIGDQSLDEQVNQVQNKEIASHRERSFNINDTSDKCGQ
jgi:hypothetical protein